MAQKDFFALLNQPQRFAVDLSSLETAKNALLARLHPDRFVNASALEKRLAEQMSVRVNEAYQTLADDLSRARYLCLLRGKDVNEHKPMPAAFLMEQMRWHERLEVAEQGRDREALDALAAQVSAEQQAIIRALEEAFDVNNDTEAAYELTRKLLFVTKLLSQIQSEE